MRMSRFVPVAFLAVLAWGGCNAIFGISSGRGGTGAGGSGGSGGTGGAGTCPPAKAATCDPKYADDGSNCCQAGRDCGDGECVDQECTAARIVGGSGTSCVSIAVIGDRLLWTRGGDLGLTTSDTDGAGKGNYLIPADVPNSGTARVVVDDSVSPAIAYFTDYLGTTVGRTPVDEEHVELFAELPQGQAGQARYGNILVHDEYVYWAMQLEEGDPSSGRDIWRAKKQPLGALVVTAEKVIANSRPLALVADEASLYFGDSEKGTIERIPWSALAEGASLPATSETFVSNAAETAGADIGEMAIDDTFIYWGSGKRVFAMPKSAPDGERKIIGPAPTVVGVILADGRDIYYSTLGYDAPSELYRAPKGGEGAYPKKLFDTGDPSVQIFSIAQDCGHIYALIHNNCDVYKLTK